MTTYALAPSLDLQRIPNEFQHYRISNAAYGLVGLENGLGDEARELANRLADQDVRLGVVTLCGEDPDRCGDELAILLSSLTRVLVVEPVWFQGKLHRHVAQLLDEPCHPHLFHVTYSATLNRDQLARAVDTMLRHGDEEIQFGPN